MTITFPNPSLFDNYPIATNSFKLVTRQSVSRQAAGNPIVADFGAAVWHGDYVTPPMTHKDCIQVEAMLNSLDGGVNQIVAGDTRLEYPRAYPTGVFSDTGSITAWGVSGKSVTITGLPAGFVISIGDYFHANIGGIRYLFQAVEAVTANGSGATTDFEIRPHYPIGASGTVAAIFRSPRARVKLVPGSIEFQDGGGLTGTVSFKMAQEFT